MLASASYAYTNSTCHIYKIDDDNTYTLILTGAAEWFFFIGEANGSSFRTLGYRS